MVLGNDLWSGFVDACLSVFFPSDHRYRKLWVAVGAEGELRFEDDGPEYNLEAEAWQQPPATAVTPSATPRRPPPDPWLPILQRYASLEVQVGGPDNPRRVRFGADVGDLLRAPWEGNRRNTLCVRSKFQGKRFDWIVGRLKGLAIAEEGLNLEVWDVEAQRRSAYGYPVA